MSGASETSVKNESQNGRQPWGLAGLLAPVLVVIFGYINYSPSLIPGPIVGLVVVALGGSLYLAAFRAHRELRQIRNLPRAHIGSVAVGLARLEGRAHGAATSTAPFSGAPSVYWQTEVHELEPAGLDEPPHWRRIFAERHCAEVFHLEDATGSIAVLPAGADLLPATYELTTFDGPTWASTSGPRREFLDRLSDVAPGPMSPNARPLRVQEIRLEEGAEMSVVGSVAVAEQSTLAPIAEAEPIVYLSTERAGWVPASPWKTGLELLERWLARRNLSAPTALQPAGGPSWTGPSWDGGIPLGVPRAGSPVVSAPVVTKPELPTGVRRTQLIVSRGAADRPFVISERPEALADGHLVTWMRVGLVLGPAAIVWGLLGLILSYIG
jgi:hypothetical protein